LLLTGCSFNNQGHLPSADEILGEWRLVSGAEPTVLYFSAGEDGRYYYTTSLNGRPAEAGTYFISRGKLVLFADQNTTYEGTALLIKGDELSYVQDGLKVKLAASERSRRCSPLFRYLRKRSGLNFSGPVTLDFSWLLPSGDEVTVNGFELSAGEAGDSHDLAAGLKELGFARDGSNSTDAMTGYRRDKVVCQVFRQETADGPALIIVRCGLLVP
jgi:hypothetical protein